MCEIRETGGLLRISIIRYYRLWLLRGIRMWNRSVFLIALPLQIFAQTVRIPFVGCETLGQIERLKAPVGNDETLRIDAAMAERLAYYKAAYGSGVLAPRGWYCLETAGSSGGDLVVLPEPKWGGITGPAVLLHATDGGGSGMYEVAKVIARVFPAYRGFVQGVIASEVEPGECLPIRSLPERQVDRSAKAPSEVSDATAFRGAGHHGLAQSQRRSHRRCCDPGRPNTRPCNVERPPASRVTRSRAGNHSRLTCPAGQ